MPAQVPALPAHFNIEPELREQLGKRPGLQRCVEGHDELLLIVHDVPRPAVAERAMFFWRRHDGRWTQPGGPGLDELTALLDRYTNAIESRQAAVNQVQGAAEIFAIARNAGPLARSIRELSKALDQALSFDPEDREILDCTDRAKELERAAELLQADARMTLDFLRTEHGETLNAAVGRMELVIKRLAVVVTLFVPLVAIILLLGTSAGISWPLKIVAWLATAGALVVAGGLLGIGPRLRFRKRESHGADDKVD